MGFAYVHVIEERQAERGIYQARRPGLRLCIVQGAYRDAGGQRRLAGQHGYDAKLAEAAVASGRADLVASASSSCHPDLFRRLREGADLNTPDQFHPSMVVARQGLHRLSTLA